MAKRTHVTEKEAGALHALLAEVMEVGLRQQLMSGEIDNALLRNVIAYLNNNKITVTHSGEGRIASLLDLVQTMDLDLPESRY